MPTTITEDWEPSDHEYELLAQIDILRQTKSWSARRTEETRLIRQLCDRQGFKPNFARTAHNERITFFNQRYGELLSA